MINRGIRTKTKNTVTDGAFGTWHVHVVGTMSITSKSPYQQTFQQQPPYQQNACYQKPYQQPPQQQYQHNT